MSNNGFTVIEALIVIVVATLIVFAGHLVLDKNHKASASTTKKTTVSHSTSSSSSPYAVLSPASVPSKAVECSQQVTYTSDGVPGPVQCSNGDLNTADWQALAALEPQVMSLGYSATDSSVQSALCSDVKANISNPIEETVYDISSIYYGWSFNPSPANILTSGSCQNADD